MSELQMILNELNRLRERVAHLETRQEHPGFAASDVARLSVAQTFTGQQIVETSANPAMRVTRTTASTTGYFAPVAVLAKTSGNMADGFGARIALQATDDTATANFGAISAARVNGTDNDGKLVLSPYSGAALVEAITILPSMDTGVGTAAPAGRVHINGTVDDEQLIVEAHSTQTAALVEYRSSAGAVMSGVRGNGGWIPASLTDAAAANNTVYYSTTAAKLVYKDGAGVVNNLY